MTGVQTCALPICIPRDLDDVPGWHKSGSQGSKGYLGTSTFRIRDMSPEEVRDRCGDKDRWPSNLYLDEGGPEWMETERRGSSRFFMQARFVPKPTRKERELGCELLSDRILRRVNPGGLEREERFAPIAVKNHHTTCKPINLMRWLCNLFAPKNGVILDPFSGSGTTGCAAIMDGFRFVGIENDPEYVEISQARLQYWSERKDSANAQEEE